MVRLPFIKYNIALRYRQIFATIIPGVQPVKDSSDGDCVINQRELCRTSDEDSVVNRRRIPRSFDRDCVINRCKLCRISDEDSVVNRRRIPRSFDRDSVIIQPVGRNVAF